MLVQKIKTELSITVILKKTDASVLDYKVTFIL